MARSRWSLHFVKKLTIFEVSSTTVSDQSEFLNLCHQIGAPDGTIQVILKILALQSKLFGWFVVPPLGGLESRIRAKRRPKAELRTTSYPICASALLVLSVIILSLGEPSRFAPLALCAEPETQSATAQEVRKWVRNLNSDRFIEREVATAKLIEAGAQSVAPLVSALTENNLEVTTRAVYVLRELALSLDPKAESAARAALKKMAEPRVTAAARRARETLVTLDILRQDRALAELKKLGAVVKDQQSAMVFGVVQQYTIEIGDAWRGQAKDLSRLSWLKDVGGLILDGPKVTDQWLEHVPKSGGPLVLTIKQAKITDQGIKHLVGVKNLQVLSLLYVPISDKSVPALQQVAVAGKIRIYGSRMTRAGAERLQQALAGTEVDFRLGAFLGVGCQSGEQGCVVYTVRPGTAAAKVGLLPQDVIYEYDGQKVTEFEVLTALISEDQSGDTVTIKILRGDEKKELRVTLGECDE